MPYTPENNPYIPGDPYSYDLNWIVDHLKTAIELYQPLNNKFDDLYEYVMNYFANLDISDELAATLAAMAADGTLTQLIAPYLDAYVADTTARLNNQDGRISEISDNVGGISEDINVLSARMDTFASLPAGSTSGNAELLDIRVAANGAGYPSAGDAVRGQYKTLDAKYADVAAQIEEVNILPANKLSDANQRYNSGITYTINNDTGAVSAVGTAVYDAWIHLYPAGDFDVAAGGLFKLEGCPAGGSAATYFLRLETANNVTLIDDFGEGAYIDLPANQNVRVIFMVKTGVTVSLAFTPVLRKIAGPGTATQEALEMFRQSAYIQRWNNAARQTDKYYTLGANGSININTSSGYRINKFYAPAGDLYYNWLSGAFTIICDLVTGTAATLQNGFNKSQYLHGSSISLPHPALIFATSNDETQPLVTNSPVFPASYVYGYYAAARHVIVDPSGNGDFMTLKAGIEYAMQFDNAVVDVKAGTYDLISEFGAAYFANMNSGSSELSGISIGRGITINFSPASKVICHYTGSNQYVKTKFSPFNMAPGSAGFTLNGLTLECSNVRYAIHDECNGHAALYHNRYVDCRISKDNSNNINWPNLLVIGGGLGLNGHIDIVRCYFNSAYIAPQSTGKSVNYHNAAGANAKSSLYIDSSYFDGLYTCGVSYYGASTEMTTMQVSNCSLPADPYVNAEGSATLENVRLLTFNNEIR